MSETADQFAERDEAEAERDDPDAADPATREQDQPHAEHDPDS
jgi:hypothetical protein